MLGVAVHGVSRPQVRDLGTGVDVGDDAKESDMDGRRERTGEGQVWSVRLENEGAKIALRIILWSYRIITATPVSSLSLSLA